jgi:methylenetetrahydrofolate reductase (NADPH)
MTGAEPDATSELRGNLRRASLEVSAREPGIADTLRGRLAPGSDVFISFPPGEAHHAIVHAAASLRRAGFNPVPHVAARNLASFTQLDDYLARAAGEAGVTRALVIAGDADPPRGPFGSTLDLIETGLFEKRRITSLGIAGYPEPSARIPHAVLDAAFERKLRLAGRGDLDLWIATQFCFEAAPIIAWVRAARARGVALPIQIGLAGPASVATLLKFAIRCGIGTSLGALRRRPDSITRLLGEADPGDLLCALAPVLGRDEAPPVGLHFYTFGGVPKTLDWIAAMVRRLERVAAAEV